MGRTRAQHGAGMSNQHSQTMTAVSCPSVARLSPWHVSYVETAQLERWLESSELQPLGIVSYGQHPPPIPSAICPIVQLDLPQLNDCPLTEVWTRSLPVHTTEQNGVRVAFDGEVLFGYLQVEEPPGTSLESITCDAYRRLLSQIRGLGYSHLGRVWNYFPRMNSKSNGLERYQQFCVGRHQALAESLPGFPNTVAAGTAVGTRSGPLQIFFLAGTKPGIHVANPRQMNAYDYPRIYSPRSPSFARATLWQSEHGSQLFIAGTASVVGHASQHAGLPDEQTRETIRNVKALMAQAERVQPVKRSGSLQQALYKVYLRHEQHLALVRDILREHLPPHIGLLMLQGDLCRRELLLEVEGVVMSD